MWCEVRCAVCGLIACPRRLKAQKIDYAKGPILPLCRDATAGAIRVKLDRSSVVDVIFNANVISDRIRGFYSARGRESAFPII